MVLARLHQHVGCFETDTALADKLFSDEPLEYIRDQTIDGLELVLDTLD
jgi:hypothetical protein